MAEPALMPFVDNDEFLRRVRLPDHIKDKTGLVHWRAFKDNDPRMSLTFRDEELRTDVGLDAYHKYFSDSIGQILPAILWFTFYGLTRGIDPPMEPRLDPDPDDAKYGRLHCSTNCPRDRVHMQLIAKLVNDGEHAGIARRYPKRAA